MIREKVKCDHWSYVLGYHLYLLNSIIIIILYIFLTLICIPTEDEAGEVGIGKVDMACGGNVLGVKIAPTSCDYIASMLNGDFVFISICFMIIYRINY